ncbi:hypothetical protein HNP38_003012 [Chryseobacterium defluvii]|uniref:DUF8202 domain-containing protein n=1 Tax=Chryseobacterium defluvii TaxID=160396 RepID=A0A840KET2_9FLAO|nr:T9SS type A sorting domain-containing protein [Chryseobacterium defluvii]MBB4807696.1 hypothetical protein [Chryseobacterium defluvii]
MYRSLRAKILAILFISCSLPAFSQLVGSDVQLWEKTDPTAREALKCKDENLLNFHCGIKDKLLKKYIKHSRNKSHTLTVVHASREDDAIWENPEKNISLNNNVYRTGEDKSIQLRKRPSIFSFMNVADSKKEKTDSLKIKFKDQNLYEMIFIPKRTKGLPLNKIHSYLSIKYGISLDQGKYFSSDGKVIWDPEKHKDYKYRPTGLGRDDGNELYQKQSSNQADQFLTIGRNDIMRTNTENKALLDNYDFMIWSDDNKEMALNRDSGLDVLQRNWEINFIGAAIPKTDYKVRINKATVNPGSKPLDYWMLVKSSNGDVAKFQGTADENFVTFSKVDFISNDEKADITYFTFAVSPSKEKGSDTNANLGTQYSTNDLSLDLSKIVLYPNPVKKGQNFTILFPPMENLSVAIYDGSGRLVRLDKIDRKANHYVSQLSIQSAYIINLTQNGKIIKTFKLIVD